MSKQGDTSDAPGAGVFVHQDGDGKVEFFRGGECYLRSSQDPADQIVDVRFSFQDGVGRLPFAAIVAKAETPAGSLLVMEIRPEDTVRLSGFTSGQWKVMFDGVIDRLELSVDNERSEYASEIRARSIYAEKCGHPISWQVSSTNWKDVFGFIGLECGFATAIHSPASEDVLNDRIDVCGNCTTSLGALKLLGFMLNLTVSVGRDSDFELLPAGAASIQGDPIVMDLSKLKGYRRSMTKPRG